jgi:cytochrome c-type biogenesis protein CcmH/NrfG
MRRWVPVLGFAWLLAMTSSEVCAQVQVGTIRGKVVDSEGNAIADARVSVKATAGRGLTYQSKTKKDGTFLQITTATSGPWTLSVSMDGYQTWEIREPVEVPLGRDAVQLGTITLWRTGDARAPVAMTQEQTKKAAAERRELDALSTRVDQATAFLEAAEAAQQAGDAALATQRLDAAEAAYRALVDANPLVARLRFNLGLVYEKKRQWDSAAAEYIKAAELKPEMVEALAAASAMYLSAGQSAAAAELLEKSLKDQPDNGQLQLLLGMARFNEGNYPAASALFEKVRQTDAANAEPYYYLGVIAVAQNRVPESIAMLQKYIAMRPANARNLKVAEDMLRSLRPKK